jgi:hypothetical protein
MTSEPTLISPEYRIEVFGSYPSHAENIHEATLLWVLDENAGHPLTSLRGFWREPIAEEKHADI